METEVALSADVYVWRCFHSAGGVQPIPWATRMSVAIGVARGLAFLHSLDANVIYRDLKASNILLDSVCSKQ